MASNGGIYFILLFIFILLISLSFHELGHFLFAKMFKVRVLEFSIGVGPRIFSIRKNNTQYSFRALLLGAYVQMDSVKLKEAYKELVEETKKEEWFREEVTKLPWSQYISLMFKGEEKGYYWKHYFSYRSYKRELSKITLKRDNLITLEDASNWKKILIALAGVFFNLILCGIFMIIALYALGWNNVSTVFDQAGEFYKSVWYTFIWTKLPGFEGGGTGVEVIVDAQWFIDNFVNLMIVMNFSFILLNILPIPPLDGFRVLTITFNSIFKKDIPEKVEVVIQLIGLLLTVYISISSVIQSLWWYS